VKPEEVKAIVDEAKGWWDVTTIPEHIRPKMKFGTASTEAVFRGKTLRSKPVPQILFMGLTPEEKEELKEAGFDFDWDAMLNGGAAEMFHKEKPPLEKIAQVVRPKISWANFKSVMAALLTGKRISRERQMARLEVCHGCEKFQWDGANARCGVCGCKLDGDKSLVKLTLYEETEAYGCKHPEGSRWKAAGV